MERRGTQAEHAVDIICVKMEAHAISETSIFFFLKKCHFKQFVHTLAIHTKIVFRSVWFLIIFMLWKAR